MGQASGKPAAVQKRPRGLLPWHTERPARGSEAPAVSPGPVLLDAHLDRGKSPAASTRTKLTLNANTLVNDLTRKPPFIC